MGNVNISIDKNIGLALIVVVVGFFALTYVDIDELTKPTIDYTGWASQLGLNTAEFSSCLNSEEITKKVREDQRDASANLNIRGTPTLLIGNDNGYYQIPGVGPSQINQFSSVLSQGGNLSEFNLTKINGIPYNSSHYSKGSDSAPVTIVEFSDFECPFCQRFYHNTIKELESQVNSGQIKFVYRQFPLEQIHKEALPAAVASECAGQQGKFWEYHDLIFENYNAF